MWTVHSLMHNGLVWMGQSCGKKGKTKVYDWIGEEPHQSCSPPHGSISAPSSLASSQPPSHGTTSALSSLNPSLCPPAQLQPCPTVFPLSLMSSRSWDEEETSFLSWSTKLCVMRRQTLSCCKVAEIEALNKNSMASHRRWGSARGRVW